MKIGFIGLGKMGSRMVIKLLQDNHEVVVWNRSPQPVEELKNQISKIKEAEQRLKIANTVEELIQNLSAPRVVWSMLPAGEVTENMVTEISQCLAKDDMVIDGGNAHFQDTQKRSEMLIAKGIKFLGVGVSGGIIAETNGYPLMVGGDKSAYDYLQPIFASLAKPNGGYAYFGQGGAGHFVKMVHNAVEYGMMQAIGEGFEVLKKSSYQFDLLNVAKLWQKGTIVSSFLIDRAADALQKDQELTETSGNIPRGGEGDWTVDAAKEEHVPVPVIETSVEYRKKSETDSHIQESYTAKMLNALRHEFGGHEVKK